MYPEEKTQLDAAAQLSIRRFILHILLDQNAEVTYRSLADYLGELNPLKPSKTLNLTDNFSGRSVESIDPIMNVLEQSGLVQTSNRTQALHYQTIRYVGDEKSLRNEYSRPQKHINNLVGVLPFPDPSFLLPCCGLLTVKSLPFQMQGSLRLQTSVKIVSLLALLRSLQVGLRILGFTPMNQANERL